MTSIAQKKHRNQKQRSRRMEAINNRRQKRKAQWGKNKKKLTEEQKKARAQRIIDNKKKRKEQEELRAKRIDSENAKILNKALDFVFNQVVLQGVAKLTGYVKRNTGKITPLAFIYILSFGFFGNGHIALPNLASSLGVLFNITVTAQALSKRINSKAGVAFLKATFQKLMDIHLKVRFKNRMSEMFPSFSGIYLEDSSQITLNEMLAAEYAGSGGSASKSSIKLNFIYDIMNYVAINVKTTRGIVSDQANSFEILQYVKQGSLVIRDLGFFAISPLIEIAKKGAYYLSRLSIMTNVYLNENDENPLDILKFLEKQKKIGKGSVSVDVCIGKEERFKTRLVAESVPSTVVRQRQDRYRKENKKEPSAYYTEWCGYSIFITNIPEAIFSGTMIIALYKIRWQIEWMFRIFKSNIELDVIKGTNKNRIESLVYGKLITIVAISMVHNYAAHIAQDNEVSGDKLTKWLDTDQRLKQAILNGSILDLLILLESDIMMVLKQKRTRKTTLGELKDQLQRENEIQEYQLAEQPT